MHATLIRNPISGNPKRQAALELAIVEFKNAGWTLDIRQTEYKGHARKLAEQAVLDGFQKIVVAGGDGSIGQVASGIVSTGAKNVRLGILPLGTGNVFARDVGLPYAGALHRNPSSAAEAARIILSGDAIPIDVGLANGDAFLCWAGCGLDAAIADQVETNLTFNKRKWPIATYAGQALKMLTQYTPQPTRIVVDGRDALEGNYYLIVASNIAMYARYFRLTPRAYLNDGYLDLLVVDAGRGLGFALSAFKLATLPSLPDSRLIRYRFRHLEITATSPQPYHLDGDPFGVTPLNIEVLPKRLPVYLDRTRARRRLT